MPENRYVAISSSAPPDAGSGISTYAKELAIGFIEKGYKVLFISPPPRDQGWLKENGLEHFPTEPLADQVEIARNLLSKIRAIQPKGVINNDNPVVQALMPLIPCPSISVGHLNTYSIASLAVWNYPWCDYIVAISSDMKDNFVKNRGIDVARCPVIHNGMKIPNDEELVTTSNRKLKVICATEYSRRKGGDQILKLCEMFAKSELLIDFRWYGHMPKKVARRICSIETVNAMGRVPRHELISELRNSDVFLMASRMEGCPMSLLEAMSFGIVPITSDGIGAMRWLVTNGVDGFVCNINDWPRQAFRCIEALEKNRSMLRDMAELTRKRFLCESSIERVVDDLSRLLENPTVSRSSKPTGCVDIINWHRPGGGGVTPSLLEKIYWRLGRLIKVGRLDVS